MKNTSESSRPESPTGEAFRDYYPVIAPLIMSSGVGDGKTTACLVAQAAQLTAERAKSK